MGGGDVHASQELFIQGVKPGVDIFKFALMGVYFFLELLEFCVV